MTTIRKSVSYAYPSSDMARRFGRAEEGCFYVDCTINGKPAKSGPAGPWTTVQAAEAWADRLPGDWCPIYTRHPLPGSRFAAAA